MNRASAFDFLEFETRWVGWRNEPRRDDPTKTTKTPRSPHTGKKAEADDPKSWNTRSAAEAWARRNVNGQGGGIGIELGDLGDGTSLGGIDLDTCLIEGKFDPWAVEVIHKLGSYTEVSPSGTGAKIFFRYKTADLPQLRAEMGGALHGKMFKRANGADHPPAIELHLSNRYFATTEQRLGWTPDRLVTVATEHLLWVLKKAGPAFSRQSAVDDDPFSGHGDRFKTNSNDKSRSAIALRKGAALRRAGKTFEEMVAALHADPETAAWTREKGEANGQRELRRIWDKAAAEDEVSPAVSFDDFYALMPMHNYIFVPTGSTWPSTSVNSRIPPVPLLDKAGKPVVNKKGEEVFLTAATWLDRNKPVEQMTWAPGMPTIVRDKLMRDGGGWQEHPGRSCFNLYHPPIVEPGDPAQAERWVAHIRRIYPAEADHIISWLAHRVQFPGAKVNHAVLLGGAPGIGKDTLLVPVVYAIGQWNFREASPVQILDRFTDFLKAVILRISETRDLGDSDRFKFYDHLKPYTAAPPDTLVVNEKHLRPYSIPNVCGVALTTNYRLDGMYIPADDRRIFVAWSDSRKEDFDEQYWNDCYAWYADCGLRHVAAYLRQLDISSFNPKAPPPKTEAWHAIVMHNNSAEERELDDVLDGLGRPGAVPLGKIQSEAKSGLCGSESLGEWITDRKNRRAVAGRLEKCGYVPVRNPEAKDGLWVIGGRRQTVYGKEELSFTDRLAAARKLI